MLWGEQLDGLLPTVLENAVQPDTFGWDALKVQLAAWPPVGAVASPKCWVSEEGSGPNPNCKDAESGFSLDKAGDFPLSSDARCGVSTTCVG